MPLMARYSFLKKNNWDMDKIKTGNLIKRLDDIFVEETRLRVKSFFNGIDKFEEK